MMNAAIFFNHDHYSYYDKSQLMPFGEYVPFKPLFHFFNIKNIIPGSEFSFGTHHPLFTLNNITIRSAICLESTFPWLTPITSVNKQPNYDLIVSLSNTAWFKNSFVSEHYFNMGIFRAIEHGTYFIQSSNKGVSGIISPTGKIITQTQLNEQAIIQETLPLYTYQTIYKIIGNLVPFLCVAFILLFPLNNLSRFKKLK